MATVPREPAMKPRGASGNPYTRAFYESYEQQARRSARVIANLISPTVTDPNAYTPEFKGFLVKLEKA